MHIFLVILTVVLFVGLVLLAGLQPVRSALSLKELKRRSKHSDAGVLELDRYELYPALTTLIRGVQAILLVVLVCTAIGGFGWGVGVLVALILALVYPAVSRAKFISRWIRTFNKKIEPFLLDTASRFEGVLQAFREPSVAIRAPIVAAHSREELTEIIDHSKDILDQKERQLLMAALAFPAKTVESCMTPREDIHFIKRTEFLGPLVLDELHAKGHSRLPVIAEDLDHIVGVLHLRDLLSLDIRQSTTAENAMEKRVHTIAHTETLENALNVLLKTRHTLLIVINESSETVGLLTLEDVIEVLTGRKLHE